MSNDEINNFCIKGKFQRNCFFNFEKEISSLNIDYPAKKVDDSIKIFNSSEEDSTLRPFLYGREKGWDEIVKKIKKQGKNVKDFDSNDLITAILRNAGFPATEEEIKYRDSHDLKQKIKTLKNSRCYIKVYGKIIAKLLDPNNNLTRLQIIDKFGPSIKNKKTTMTVLIDYLKINHSFDPRNIPSKIIKYDEEFKETLKKKIESITSKLPIPESLMSSVIQKSIDLFNHALQKNLEPKKMGDSKNAGYITIILVLYSLIFFRINELDGKPTSAMEITRLSNSKYLKIAPSKFAPFLPDNPIFDKYKIKSFNNTRKYEISLNKQLDDYIDPSFFKSPNKERINSFGEEYTKKFIEYVKGIVKILPFSREHTNLRHKVTNKGIKLYYYAKSKNLRPEDLKSKKSGYLSIYFVYFSLIYFRIHLDIDNFLSCKLIGRILGCNLEKMGVNLKLLEPNKIKPFLPKDDFTIDKIIKGKHKSFKETPCSLLFLNLAKIYEKNLGGDFSLKMLSDEFGLTTKLGNIIRITQYLIGDKNFLSFEVYKKVKLAVYQRVFNDDWYTDKEMIDEIFRIYEYQRAPHSIAEENGLELLSDPNDYKNQKSIMLWKCRECNHEFDKSTGNIIKALIPCTNCREKIDNLYEYICRLHFVNILSYWYESLTSVNMELFFHRTQTNTIIKHLYKNEVYHEFISLSHVDGHEKIYLNGINITKKNIKNNNLIHSSLNADYVLKNLSQVELKNFLTNIADDIEDGRIPKPTILIEFPFGYIELRVKYHNSEIKIKLLNRIPKINDDKLHDVVKDFLKIGFEFNGNQHYIYPNHLHEEVLEFLRYVTNDLIKKKIYEEQNHILIEFPNYRDLKMNHPKIIQDYIIKELEKRLEINLIDIPQFNHMKYINSSKYNFTDITTYFLGSK